MQKFEIWAQGYRATGEHSTAQFYGVIEAENFVEACKKRFEGDPSFSVEEPIEITSETARLGLKRMGINQETRCYLWICRLFDNETDARKAWG